MSKDKFILPQNERPSWVAYPHSFCRLVEQELIHLTPWHIMEGQRALVHLRGLAERYPTRELFPFAYRQVTRWTRFGDQKAYQVGRRVRLEYVLQRPKKPWRSAEIEQVLQIVIEAD